MKSVAIAVLAVVACAYGTSVCIPTPNSVRSQAWSDVDKLYIGATEILDVSANAFRRTDEAFFSPRPGKQQAIAHDILVLGDDKVTYVVSGIPGINDSFACKIITDQAVIQDPCFTHNGTHIATNLIGTTIVDNFFGQDNNHGVQHYTRIMIAKDGTPVSVSEWTTMSNIDNLMSNFNRTLPANAFAINPLCHRATPLNVPLAAFLKQHKADTFFKKN